MLGFGGKHEKLIKEIPFKTVLVAVNGSQESYRSIQIAAELVRRTPGHLLLLHIIEVPLTLPLTAALPDKEKNADNIIGEGARIARQNGARAVGRVEKSRSVKDGILKVARDSGAEAVLFPIKPAETDGIFSPTVEYVMKRANVEIVMTKSKK